MTQSTWMSVFLGQASPSMGEFGAQLVPIVLIFGIFYLLLIAPARKRQKAHEAVLSSLKRGDRVVTSGGLLGEVAAVDNSVVQLKIADNVKVRVNRSAIAGMQGDPSAEKDSQ